jgi:hypothetical protein
MITQYDFAVCRSVNKNTLFTCHLRFHFIGVNPIHTNKEYCAHTHVTRIQIPPDHHSFSYTRNGFHYRIPDYNTNGTTPHTKRDVARQWVLKNNSQPARTIIITYELHCFPFPQSLAMLCTYVANHRTQSTVLITYHSYAHTPERAGPISQSRRQTLDD